MTTEIKRLIDNRMKSFEDNLSYWDKKRNEVNLHFHIEATTREICGYVFAMWDADLINHDEWEELRDIIHEKRMKVLFPKRK